MVADVSANSSHLSRLKRLEKSSHLMRYMWEQHFHDGHSLQHCFYMIKNLSKQIHIQHHPSKTGFQVPTNRHYDMFEKSRCWNIQAYNRQTVHQLYQNHHRKLDPGCLNLHSLCQIKFNFIWSNWKMRHPNWTPYTIFSDHQYAFSFIWLIESTQTNVGG